MTAAEKELDCCRATLRSLMSVYKLIVVAHGKYGETTIRNAINRERRRIAYIKDEIT